MCAYLYTSMYMNAAARQGVIIYGVSMVSTSLYITAVTQGVLVRGTLRAIDYVICHYYQHPSTKRINYFDAIIYISEENV